MIYNVFGSKTSHDRDILIFVDEIPNLESCKKKCIELNDLLKSEFPDDKIINSNLGVLKDGVLTQVFKGTPDEVNNSVFLTYTNHFQNYAPQVDRIVPRDTEKKALRVARILLSFYSKTVYREIVKKALQGDIFDKIRALQLIDFSMNYDFGKKQQAVDIYKNVAFQLGQILALWDNKELYTKEEIGKLFPQLVPFLERKDSVLIELNILKNEYLDILIQKSKCFKNLKE